MHTSRLLSMGLFILAIGLAWLLNVVGYIISPMYDHITVTDESLSDLTKASKIFFWGTAGSLIVGLVAAAGVIEIRYTSAANVVSVSMMSLIVIATVSSASSILFLVI